MSADPTLSAALALDGVWLFAALKIAFPDKTVRLIDGSAVMTINGEAYAGEDVDFGTIAAADAVTESNDDEAPEISFSFFPADATALATLASPDMQGSVVTILIGAVDPASMTPIGTPEIVFLGEIDVPTMTTSEKDRRVDFTAVSVFERLFEIDEGQRATDGFHQSIWPGELGLSQMTGTLDKLYWGANPPAASDSTAGAFGSGYGGYGANGWEYYK